MLASIIIMLLSFTHAICSLLSQCIDLNLFLKCLQFIFESLDLDDEELAILPCIAIKTVTDELIDSIQSMILIFRRYQVIFIQLFLL